MILRRTFSTTFVIAALVQVPLGADVTITETVSTKAAGQSPEIRRVIFIKGSSMRVDGSRGDDRSTTIYDVAAGRIVVMNPGRKQAEIHEMAKVSTAVEQKLPSHRVSSELEPTGRSKELLGVDCEEYTFVITAPIGRDAKTLFSLRGSVWIAKGGAGLQDFLTFNRAAAEQHVVFGDFNSTRAVLALTRGQTELYQRVGALGGMPYAIDMKFKFDGTGATIGLANKMAAGTRVTTTTTVVTTPIPDETFTIPAGWKIKNK